MKSELVDEFGRRALVQYEAELRVGLLQRRDEPGKHVGRERRDDAEPQHAAERRLLAAREVADRAYLVEDGAGAGDDALAGGGRLHAARGALEEPHAERLLELPHLGAERRLAHMATLGGAPEVSRVGDGDDVAQLGQRDRGEDP